jgi:hypothetical protein
LLPRFQEPELASHQPFTIIFIRKFYLRVDFIGGLKESILVTLFALSRDGILVDCFVLLGCHFALGLGVPSLVSFDELFPRVEYELFFEL